MTGEDLIRLAKQNGIAVETHNFSEATKLKFHFPWGRRRSVLTDIILYIKKGTGNDTDRPCLAVLYYRTSAYSSVKYNRTVHFYMDSEKEAFSLVFGFLVCPERIRYESVKGGARKSLSEKKFALTGRKEIGDTDAPLIMVIYKALDDLFQGICEVLLAPFFCIFKNYDYMRLNNSRKWEYITEVEGKYLMLIRRYCGGRYKRLTRKEPWMQMHDIF